MAKIQFGLGHLMIVVTAIGVCLAVYLNFGDEITYGLGVVWSWVTQTGDNSTIMHGPQWQR